MFRLNFLEACAVIHEKNVIQRTAFQMESLMENNSHEPVFEFLSTNVAEKKQQQQSTEQQRNSHSPDSFETHSWPVLGHALEFL
jgi:hypothetical protein